MLHSLAPEILHYICRQLDDAVAVSRFRLVCKSFATVGLRSLVPRVTVVTLPKAFEHLNDVANHPVLRHHVIEIVFVTNKLPIYLNIDDFARGLSSQMMLSWPVAPTEPHANTVDRVAYERHRWSEDQVRGAWTYYRELCEQQQIQEESDGLYIVRKAIAQLPRLRSIHIRQLTDQDGLVPYLWPGTEYGKFAINLTGTLSNKVFSTSSLLENILSATLAARTSLQSLFVAVLYANVFRLENNGFEDIKQSLEQLRDISLQLQVEDEAESDSWDLCRRLVEKGGLPQILHSATQLRNIEIVAPYVAIEEHVVSFPRLFNGMVWSRLLRLHLVGFKTTSESLATFLEAHASSLKVLELTDFGLSGQHVREWHSFFVSCASFLDLEEARFTGHFTADLSDAGDEYVDMRDDIKGLPMTLGEALGALLCGSCSETEDSICRETFDDLLKHGKKRLATGFSMDIPIRHSQFLRDIQTSWRLGRYSDRKDRFASA